jgi:hypothetical protein
MDQVKPAKVGTCRGLESLMRGAISVCPGQKYLRSMDLAQRCAPRRFSDTPDGRFRLVMECVSR